jgi:hypothetical protein
MEGSGGKRPRDATMALADGVGAGKGPVRSSSVTGSAGPVGAAFALAEKSWRCDKCKADNLARRPTCVRCRGKKPAGGGGHEWHEGAVLAAGGEDHGWREALEPGSKQIYYFHAASGRTQWDRPAEMGRTLTATGWYGRGKAGAQGRLDEANAAALQRPAIKQVDETQAREVSYVQGSEQFNIYYGKYNGEHWSKRRNVEPAKTRCKPEMHAGWTQADKRGKEGAFWCAMWAKGCCFKGQQCGFFHRVPVYADVGRLEKDALHDLFGRDRHAEHRDDMQGVGSFNNPSRTLYVGKLQRTPYAEEPKKLEAALQRHFEEFGEVEQINLIWAKAIAFVRFRFRTHAELAREALADQSLDHDEILDIKWAYDDPNPVAQEAARRANADAVLAAIQAAGHSVDKTAFSTPAGYQPPEQAKPQGKPQASIADAALHYPDTNSQFVTAQDTSAASFTGASATSTGDAAAPPKRAKPKQAGASFS